MDQSIKLADLALRVILGIVGLGVFVFTAGKAWATVEKLIGSTAAIHRRLSEDQQERRLRDREVDVQFMNLRLAIQALQTWKSTMRFKGPEAEVPMFKDEHP